MTVTPGKNFEGQHGFPTPSTIPGNTVCRVFRVPDNDEWLGVLMGAVEVLIYQRNWYNWGAVTIEDTIDAWRAIVDAAYAESLTGTCPTNMVDTPFWDSASDVGDDAPVDSQMWYGEVTNVLDPPASLTWFENAAIWTFTGLLAVSGTPAAAVLFNTVASKFVLSQKAGAVGEVIRIVVDAQDIAMVDTTGLSGQIIETPVVTTSGVSPHQVMLIKVS